MEDKEDMKTIEEMKKMEIIEETEYVVGMKRSDSIKDVEYMKGFGGPLDSWEKRERAEIGGRRGLCEHASFGSHETKGLRRGHREFGGHVKHAETCRTW